MSVLTVFKSMISGVLTLVFVALQRVPRLTRHPALATQRLRQVRRDRANVLSLHASQGTRMEQSANVADPRQLRWRVTESARSKPFVYNHIWA